MATYESLLQDLVSRNKPVASKRIGNNTYVERLFRDEAGEYQVVDPSVVPPEAVAIRLHKTRVLIFTRDGQVIFHTGGWKTVTTKDRINTFAPQGVRVFSVKGEWQLTTHAGDAVPFREGVTVARDPDDHTVWTPVVGTYPEPDQASAVADAQRRFDSAMRGFLAAVQSKTLPAWRTELKETGSLNPNGDCLYCRGIVTSAQSGETVDDNGHLWNHLREHYLPVTLAARALGRDRDRFTLWVQLGHNRPILRAVRAYLRERLRPTLENSLVKVEPVPEEWVANARAALHRPDDFGYFGNDSRLWVSSAPTWTRTRDSEALELANFDTVWEHLASTFPDLVKGDDEHYVDRDEDPGPAIYIFGAGHWAVGHIDQIVVPVLADPDKPLSADNLHPAFKAVCEFSDAAKSYPVLDDEKYAEYQAKALNEWIDQCTSDPTDEQSLGAVREYLWSEHEVTSVEDCSDEALRDALRHANLEPVSWILPAEERV